MSVKETLEQLAGMENRLNRRQEQLGQLRMNALNSVVYIFLESIRSNNLCQAQRALAAAENLVRDSQVSHSYVEPPETLRRKRIVTRTTTTVQVTIQQEVVVITDSPPPVEPTHTTPPPSYPVESLPMIAHPQPEPILRAKRVMEHRPRPKKNKKTPTEIAVKPADQQNFLDIAQSSHPLLSHLEEIALSQQFRAGDQAAREALVMANQGLVIQIAKRYGWMGLPLTDLIQEGNLGLLKAIDRYDVTRGTRFGTLATWWIRQAIGRALANTGRLIRLPVNRFWKLSQARRVQSKLEQLSGGNPASNEDIAAQIGIDPSKLDRLFQDGTIPISLDNPIDENDRSSFERLTDSLPLPEEITLEHQRRDRVIELMTHLEEREASLITMRYGLDGQESLPLRKIAAKWKMSPEGVRQIGERALDHLRSLVSREELEDLLSEK